MNKNNDIISVSKLAIITGVSSPAVSQAIARGAIDLTDATTIRNYIINNNSNLNNKEQSQSLNIQQKKIDIEIKKITLEKKRDKIITKTLALQCIKKQYDYAIQAFTEPPRQTILDLIALLDSDKYNNSDINAKEVLIYNIIKKNTETAQQKLLNAMHKLITSKIDDEAFNNAFGT